MLNFNDKQAIFGTTKVGERGQLGVLPGKPINPVIRNF